MEEAVLLAFDNAVINIVRILKADKVTPVAVGFF
jgi:hypothetical protein